MDSIPEKTLDKDLETKGEAMGFQLDIEMDFHLEVVLYVKSNQTLGWEINL